MRTILAALVLYVPALAQADDRPGPEFPAFRHHFIHEGLPTYRDQARNVQVGDYGVTALALTLPGRRNGATISDFTRYGLRAGPRRR